MSDQAKTDISLVRGDAPRVVVFWEGGFTSGPLPATGSMVIGRGDACDLRVADPSVSRKHARLHVGHELAIEDLGSAAGVFIGETRLAPGVVTAFFPDRIVKLGAAMLTVHLKRPAPRAGEPSGMARVHELVERMAKGDISVLLIGETGVGKEITARAIHDASPRRGGPFVQINCASLNETLLESELFGHERGAFTGALATKVGLIETAAGGTFFLDEVGELPLGLQAKLLRLLETREVMRVGGLKSKRIDVRFLSATNRDLIAACAERSFRSDLYFRLNGITIGIPPLRERTDEIEPLARRFAAPALISERALRALLAYQWPGNVRELRNVLERAALLSGGQTIAPEHLGLVPPPSTPSLPPAPPSSETSLGAAPTPARTGAAVELQAELAQIERTRIIEALDACAGNQTRAAKMLGLSRRALLTRLDQYGLPRPRK